MSDSNLIRHAILRTLEDSGASLGAGRLSAQMNAAGLRAQPRTVRLHLLRMDREGLTQKVSRRLGRVLTERGREELRRTDVPGKVGFVATRIEALMHRMTYRSRTHTGSVVANTAVIREDQLLSSIEYMYPVFQRRLSVGPLVAVARGGMRLAGMNVPQGHVMIATVCSVTVNSVLLSEGIPVTSRYGALLELRDSHPLRFVELIEYAGTTLAPLELFVQAGRTSVRECARSGNGVIGASFREIPAVAREELLRVRQELERDDLGGVLAVGHPGQPLLGVPVAEGRCGLIVAGGLNPLAAIHEAGVDTSFQSITGIEDRASFMPIGTLRNRFPWWPDPRRAVASME